MKANVIIEDEYQDVNSTELILPITYTAEGVLVSSSLSLSLSPSLDTKSLALLSLFIRMPLVKLP